MSRVTLKDVAKKADVSYQTVSKVVNGKAFVTEATEARIWDAIRELDYQPNIAARNLRKQSSNMIGFSWSPGDALNPIIDRFLYSITKQMRQEGYYILMFPRDISHGGSFRDLYQTKQVSGYILTSTNHNDERVAELLEQEIPFASFGRANDAWNFNWVDIDGKHGIDLVMDHLIANGHRKIALFTWPEGSQAGEAREAGYFGKLAANGIAINSEYVWRIDGSVESGYLAAQELVRKDAADRPTAIVCVNDMIAIGAMNCITAVGLEVGKDLAVTGFDNVPMTEFLNPPLTTVQQPIEEAGKLVADMMLAQLGRKKVEPKQTLLLPELVIRSSA